MSKTPERPRRDAGNSRDPHAVGHLPQGAPGGPGHSGGRPWTWRELCVVWDHPDWTAADVAGLLDDRSAKAVRRVRERYGRYRTGRVPVCSKCGERPVWEESAHARRLGLCKGCYLDEEEMRLKDRKRNDALRQRRMRDRRRNG